MKRQWLKLADRIDAMSLRERVMVFVMLAAIVVALVNALLLDPLLAKQTRLSQQLKQDEARMAAIQAQTMALAQGRGNDPDAANRARLQALKQQVAQMDEELRSLQKGLVRPENMAQLLEDMLKRDGRLQLVSLKTLPASDVAGSGAPKEKPLAASQTSSGKGGGGAVAEAGRVYRHGVELAVRGSYADLLGYLAQVEKLPWQMFWGEAKLNVEEYPKATLTLTLYTLSLDKAWLAI